MIEVVVDIGEAGIDQWNGHKTTHSLQTYSVVSNFSPGRAGMVLLLSFPSSHPLAGTRYSQLRWRAAQDSGCNARISTHDSIGTERGDGTRGKAAGQQRNNTLDHLLSQSAARTQLQLGQRVMSEWQARRRSWSCM